MKIELGKTYRNRNGVEVEIVFNTGGSAYPFKDRDGYTYASDGTYDRSMWSNLDLIAEVIKPDLTTITTPFGLLDEDTQKALESYKGKIEMFSRAGWSGVPKPNWLSWVVYRAKLVPKVEEQKCYCVVWGKDMVITVNIVDGVMDESSLKVEVNK